MSVVDFSFYSTVYMGQEADATSFPALCARASDLVGAMTHWAVDETTIGDLPPLTQTLYKKAICAQVDCLAINGLDSLAGNESGGGFTVGKVTVHGQSAQSNAGRLAGQVSALAVSYLEQTGLMYPAVPVVGRW